MPYGKLLVEFKRASTIIRWQNERRIIETNDAEHMYDTTLIMLGLARWEEDKFGNKIDYKTLAHIGLLHDSMEVFVGDILSGVKKYNDEMKKAVKAVEEGMYKDKVEKLIPKSWRDDYKKYLLDPKSLGIEGRILAGADLISALFECIDEIQLGNTRFNSKLLEVSKSLTKIDLQSVQYFLKYSLQDLGLPIEAYGLEMSNYINRLDFEDM